MARYGAALNWRSLRHLVLRDRLATDAALDVAAYLQRHERQGRPAFGLSNGGSATFAMAEEFARCA